MAQDSQQQSNLSSEETLKRDSCYLRGTILESLADPVTGSATSDDIKLLKFHGTYQQDNRDLRVERMRQKLEPAYSFMVRVRMPGGVCTAHQWLQLDEIAQKYANHSLRITTRQTFQFHGVIKRNLKPTISGINKAGLSTIAACGDVNRNVVCHNNPYLSVCHEEVYDWAKRLSNRFLPQTGAYPEIWLDKEKISANSSIKEEPLYGETYLPRKFKIGIALPPSNDIDVFAQDLGLIAISDGNHLVGFNVSVGGGMGMTHNVPETYPRLASVIGFCTLDQIFEVAEHIIKIQRDFGNRVDRQQARLKYTIDSRSIDWFKEELNQRLGWNLEPPRSYHFESNSDPFGWVQDSKGNWHLNLCLLSGRIKDTEDQPLMTGLREIAKIHRGDFRLTTNQNLTIANIPPAEKKNIEALVEKYHLPMPEKISRVRQDAMSCVALPTCGLAMAESERMLPGFLDKLEATLIQVGLQNDPITVRVTGCPNGCGRPYISEIALVGKSLGRYSLYLGAEFAGQRLNKLYKDSLTEDEIIETLTPIFKHYVQDRNEGEYFGNFVVRMEYVEEVKEGKDFNKKPAEPKAAKTA
ncbi:NADPH-dependent assimilatory sulfite reductase hemoprotein subunit [Candidatus Nitrosacidococcus sp. I8]|uniref:NADPH-dependent assimilatory sulfite reductase hemoprotein subunit n=1 Tax=Candidatus Nitrosacidococcus sp. I8 TaxID=2942908 RepID=UPI002226DF83|nr:NADPH-dependent assimilatory sulfite reductase hemoprotein subunit [Candidatus Nitrosacidococcus sp. I8]CAH9017803.1 Sulfite reductase [NADPH] hemoprotein beta-component [Candidatus Nitrosacidococcus sp. I8]